MSLARFRKVTPSDTTNQSEGVTPCVQPSPEPPIKNWPYDWQLEPEDLDDV